MNRSCLCAAIDKKTNNSIEHFFCYKESRCKQNMKSVWGWQFALEIEDGSMRKAKEEGVERRVVQELHKHTRKGKNRTFLWIRPKPCSISWGLQRFFSENVFLLSLEKPRVKVEIRFAAAQTSWIISIVFASKDCQLGYML